MHSMLCIVTKKSFNGNKKHKKNYSIVTESIDKINGRIMFFFSNLFTILEISIKNVIPI